MDRTYPALTVDQCVDLRAFAAQYGRRWKDTLEQNSWRRGMPIDGFASLYGLRNSHGPMWLAGFKIESIGKDS